MFSAIDQEIKLYLYLVEKIIKTEFRSALSFIEYDDLYSVAMDGLWKGIESYNEQVAKEIHYAQNIRFKIKKEITRSYERKEQQRKHNFSTQSLTTKEGVDVDYDSLYDMEQELMTVELFHQLKKGLNENEIELMKGLALGYTQTEIAQKMGISQQAVSKKIRLLRVKLKSQMD